MSIYKRKETWWIEFTDPNGKRVQRTAGTKVKQEAQELHDRLKTEAWRVKNLGNKPRYTWQEAVVKWLSDQSHKKSLKDDKVHLRFLHEYFKDKHLDEINKAAIEKIKQEKQQTDVSNATINRMLALIRSILNRAKDDWEWIDTVPSVRLLPEAEKRLRWLTRDESTRLLRELPEHLELMARFTLATGLRESNVTGLQWSQIDMQRRCAWIHADQAKGKKAIAVPLNIEACDIIRSQIGKHITHIFTYESKPVTRANNHAWRKALKRARIEDFRWHDLRHTWAVLAYPKRYAGACVKRVGGMGGFNDGIALCPFV